MSRRGGGEKGRNGRKEESKSNRRGEKVKGKGLEGRRRKERGKGDECRDEMKKRGLRERKRDK